MNVLVAYATRYGATRGIAERIAAILRREGLEAVAEPIEKAGDPAAFDSVVIGSAIYFGHWMTQSASFVRNHCEALAERPVWLFSCGPLGSKLYDDRLRNLRVTCIPREIAEFEETFCAREHRVFFGAMDHRKLGLFHRLLKSLPINKDDVLFPNGDFRNWDEIDAWAEEIANEMKARGAVGRAPRSGRTVGSLTQM